LENQEALKPERYPQSVVAGPEAAVNSAKEIVKESSNKVMNILF
jgi:hypothetical protein